MALIRWEPFREVEGLQREMNRLFDSLGPSNERGFNGIAFMPAAEMQETPEAVHLRLEIPGIEAKDLDIQVTAEAVSISGERKSETKSEANGVARSEFRYGRFHRTIPLPGKVQNDKTEAEYKDGILNLTIPKAEAEKSKAFKVNLA
jgi:HSP20 family protein